jgi:hypothetical protein
MSQSDNLIGTVEAANALGWSRAKVKREAKAGRLPYELQMPGATGAYLFHRSVIDTIAANAKRQKAAAA